MKILKRISEVREAVKKARLEGKIVGFVPTMGYLHEGHKSLIEKARLENDFVVVSIFVNPTQFGPNEDLESYPRDMDRDSTLCREAGVDIIFNPEPSEMYFRDKSTFVQVSELRDGLCGKTRPVHFNGVCTVVTKLFNIVKPDRAYFGEKDAQQLAIIKRFVRDLNIDVEVIGCPIIREKDGLAKSSRNVYLSEEERKQALCLSKSLKKAKELLENGARDSKEIREAMEEIINRESLSNIDYIEIVDSETLKEVSKISKSVLIAMAIYIGKTRLIDNFTF